jgi:hypothetical protein
VVAVSALRIRRGAAMPKVVDFPSTKDPGCSSSGVRTDWELVRACGSSLPIGTRYEKRLALSSLRRRKTRGLEWDSVVRCGGTAAATGSL